jgi:hypothetical protein
MWAGTIASIPVNWALCDGQNGTPDLRDRFIRGAAAGQNPGATAGAATHAHAFTQPSGHTNHVVTQPTAHADVLNHVHTLATGTGSTGNFAQVVGTVDTSSGGTGATPTQTALGTRTGNPVAGGVASQAHTGTTVDAHSAHTGGAVVDGSTLPPFYALAFIQRVS